MQSLREVFSDSGCQGWQDLGRQRGKGKSFLIGGIYKQGPHLVLGWQEGDWGGELGGKTVGSTLYDKILEEL